MAKKKEVLNLEEKLQKALVPDWEQPYKVPSNWIWTRLDSISEIVTGGTPSKKNMDFYGGIFPFIKPTDLDQGRKVVFGSECLTEEGKSASRVVRKGSTSVCCIGSIGKCGFLEVEAATNQQINTIMPNINDLFVYYYCCTENFIQELLEKSSATTISIVNKSKMSETTFPLPPLAEQKRIVEQIESLFSKLDEAKELAQSALDSFENRKSAILHQAFTGELTNIECKDDVDEILTELELNQYNLVKEKQIQKQKLFEVNQNSNIGKCKNWQQQKLGNVAFVTKLAGFEYTKHIQIRESGEVPVIRAQNVRKGYLDLTNLMYIDKDTSMYLKRSELVKKSLLITFIGAGIGDVCIFDKANRFHLAPNVAKVEIYNDNIEVLLPKFVLYFLLSSLGQAEIFKNMKSTAQPSLSMGTIRDIDIPIAPIDEQKEIVRILDSVFEKETKAKECANVIEQIDMMKKAILARAFRGELGTNDEGEESAVILLKEILEVN